ncbi:NADP-dependent oxidoreductase domain-containing protein [Camillea tinctor]|nr:NADP-dependent oxidoreductase domain-containing protein [Camillea tinctor]
MNFFQSSPKPTNPMGYHRVLSPNAAVKVSPICLGGISIGDSWSEYTGKNEDPFKLLDAFYEIGGNFIDTANVYNNEDSEKLIGEWMEKRGVRDQMVIATKYSAHYRTYNRSNEPLQSNFIGNSIKSMYVSVRHSLKKLRTDYIDILYVHWWDFTTSVEEVMRGLHALVQAREVLYLGISNTPAWVVVKANAYAREHGLTPFSVYQGKWNASYRDMEGEVIPMCEDQGLAIVPWSALGSGQLLSAEQRRERENNPDAPRKPPNELAIAVSRALEKIANEKNTTTQAIALAYLFHQSTYVFPIVGVNTVAHVLAMSDALRVKLSKEDIDAIHEASPYDPGFPTKFFYSYFWPRKYDLSLTAADHQQIQLASWIDVPPKPLPYQPRTD